MRNSMTQQRRFTKEFEEEAVRLAQTSGRTQREIAGDLGIGLSTLVRWIGRSRDWQCRPWRRAIALATAPGGRLSATIAAFSAALQRRRCGVPVRTSIRRKLCPSIGKLLGKSASLPRPNKTRSATTRLSLETVAPFSAGEDSRLRTLHHAQPGFLMRCPCSNTTL